MIEIANDQIHEVEHFENSVLHGQVVGYGWNGIGHPELVETGTIPPFVESFPTLIGKNAVRHEGVDARGSRSLQYLTGLVERPSRLDQVIDNHNMLAGGIPVLDCHGPSVSLAASLATDDDLHTLHVLKHRGESFGGAVVRKRHAVDPPLLHFALQQGDGGLQRRHGVPVQVEPILQGVEVVDHEPGGTAAVRQAAKHVSVGGRRGHLALPDDPLHSPHGREGQDDGHGLHEALEEAYHDLKLAQRDVVVVEAGQEENVLPRNDVVGGEPANLDVVGPVGELFPRCGVEGESVGIIACHPFGQRLARLRGNDLVPDGRPLPCLLVVHDPLRSIEAAVASVPFHDEAAGRGCPSVECTTKGRK